MCTCTLLVDKISEIDIFGGCIRLPVTVGVDVAAFEFARSGAVSNRANVGLNFDLDGL